ncbi:hypothetical protein WJ63_15130 [Burkholderia pyrrocinia]|nr:hypothetical protein WJ63_15130 [Burkholderia pyrrocinia]
MSPANLVSYVRIAIIATFTTCLLVGRPFNPTAGAIVIIFAYWMLDTVDGIVSRWTKTASSFGESIDQTCDRIADFLLSALVVALHPGLALPVSIYLALRFAPDMAVGRCIGSNSALYDAAVSLDGRTVSASGRRRHRLVLEINQILKAAFFYLAIYHTTTFHLQWWMVIAGIINLFPTLRILLAQAHQVCAQSGTDASGHSL